MTQAKRLLSYLGFAAVAVYCLAPFYWMAVSAFRRPQDQFDNSIVPARWSWENFSAVFCGRGDRDRPAHRPHAGLPAPDRRRTHRRRRQVKHADGSRFEGCS